MTAILIKFVSISIAALLTTSLNSWLGSSKFLNNNRHCNMRIFSQTWYPGRCIVPPYEREGANPSPPSRSPRNPPTSPMVISGTGFDDTAEHLFLYKNGEGRTNLANRTVLGLDTHTFHGGLHSGATVYPCLRSEAKKGKEDDSVNNTEPPGKLQGSGGYGV